MEINMEPKSIEKASAPFGPALFKRIMACPWLKGLSVVKFVGGFTTFF